MSGRVPVTWCVSGDSDAYLHWGSGPLLQGCRSYCKVKQDTRHETAQDIMRMSRVDWRGGVVTASLLYDLLCKLTYMIINDCNGSHATLFITFVFTSQLCCPDLTYSSNTLVLERSCSSLNYLGLFSAVLSSLPWTLRTMLWGCQSHSLFRHFYSCSLFCFYFNSFLSPNRKTFLCVFFKFQNGKPKPKSILWWKMF